MSHSDSDCIFCKIVAGTVLSCRVFEDEHTLAFLDIAPIIQGHTLVIPKAHHNPLMAAPPETLQRLIVVVQKIAQAQVQALQADGVNVHQSNGRAAGQVVPHLHFHVIPRFTSDGHSWNWKTRPYGDPQAMQVMAERIRQGL